MKSVIASCALRLLLAVVLLCFFPRVWTIGQREFNHVQQAWYEIRTAESIAATAPAATHIGVALIVVVLVTSIAGMLLMVAWVMTEAEFIRVMNTPRRHHYPSLPRPPRPPPPPRVPARKTLLP